jgi:signal transduction histidine kinase
LTNGLLRIINDILDISKLEAGKLEVEHIDFHLPSMIREVVAAMEGSGNANQEFSVDLSPDFPEGVNADPTRIRQVLINLVGNAVKFTEQGRIDVVGALDRRSDDLVFLSFRISDTGIGIAPETLTKLFTD